MAEANQIQCPHCGQPYALPPEQVSQYAGQTIHCTTCRKPFTVGMPAGAPIPAMPPMAGANPNQPPPAMAMQYADQATMPRTDGFSIASLVCGCLLCIPLIPGALATIFGIMGIRRTRDPMVRGKGLAIAGLVLGLCNVVAWGAYFVLIVALMVPSLGRARETANRVKCASNMKSLGSAMLLYQSENGGVYPPDLGALIVTQDTSTETFCCPSSNDVRATGDTPEALTKDLSAGGHLSYVYVGVGLTQDASADHVILYDQSSNHAGDGMNVLFGDGHVEWIASPISTQMVSQIEAGQNPPPATVTNSGPPMNQPTIIESDD